MGGKPRKRPGYRPRRSQRQLTKPTVRYVIWARPRGLGPWAWPRLTTDIVESAGGSVARSLFFDWAVLHADGSGWTYPAARFGERYEVTAEAVEGLVEDFYDTVAGVFPFEFQMFEVLVPSGA